MYKDVLNIRIEICYIILVFYSGNVIAKTLQFEYHNNNELEQFLIEFSANHTDLTRVYNIGKSVNGTNLTVIEITAIKKPFGEPNVKLIGNIHGNEAVGREVLLHFIEYLVDNYKSNHSEIKWLLENTRIHILPTMNPDGYAMSQQGICETHIGRCNANNIDLNRSFPDFFQNNTTPKQPETEAIIKWMEDIPFALSASLHGGALVANYPYENSENDSPFASSQISLTPDNDVFLQLARTYAIEHGRMSHEVICPENAVKAKFPEGIVNGATWYKITGGMQDYNYIKHGCMEITLEISCCKYPYASVLKKFWLENQRPLLRYISYILLGVRGTVINIDGDIIANASLRIKGREMTFYTTSKGLFWRILLPGKYTLKINADGYQDKNVPFTVNRFSKRSSMTNLTIILEKNKVYKPEEWSGDDYLDSTSTIITPTEFDVKLGYVTDNACKVSISVFYYLVYLLIGFF